MKHAFRLSRVCALLVALAAAGLTQAARAQTLSPSPDTAIFQITSATPIPAASPTATPSPTPTPATAPIPIQRESYAGDISGDGRFVVMESTADIATDRSAARNNADANPEIFLFDYAQRRVFQLTNTRSALKDTARAANDAANIDVQIVNLQPVISRDGRFIVFISNAYVDANAALTPKNFDGQANAAALKLDANTEIWVYALPEYPAVADLSQGTEVATVDLAAGTFTRLTVTPANAPATPASNARSAFFSRDNDAPAVNDNGTLVAFHSMAKSGIPSSANADGNKEVFVVSIDRAVSPETRSYVQVTNTQDEPQPNTPLFPRQIFNINPSLSACNGVLACRLVYSSNVGTAAEAEANRGNAEIFVADINPASGAASAVRQVTKTPPETRAGIELGSVNLLSPGRRISRDGTRVVFESTAVFNADGTLNGGLANSPGIYIANVSSAAASTFELVASRPPADQLDLDVRWPTFTGDSTRVVWASNLNLNPDGTVSTTAGQGLNQSNRAQVFSAPVAALTTVSRVTNLGAGVTTAPHGSFSAIQPYPADNVRRMALTLRSEQGSGNADASSEAFYQLIPVATSETPAPSPTPATSPAPVSFSTGASDRPVVSPSPAPTPPAVTGLAPGMLGIARSTLTLAPGTLEVDRNNAHEFQRRPPLPVELRGVTVTVAGAAAGLYFVAANQINFVVPPGLTSSTTAAPVVIFNNGALIRTSVLLNPAQPDIFTSTNGAGGRAAALNVTNPCVAPTGEPFKVVTTRPAGSGATGNCTSAQDEQAATQLLFMVTGLRNFVVSATNTITVRIGTTDIASTADPATSPVRVGPSNTPGFDQVTVTLPPGLAGAGDVPVIITVSAGGVTFTSRPADSAPRITILQ